MRGVTVAKSSYVFTTFFHNLNSYIYIDVDAKILARGTPGFSGADLQNMVKYVFSATVNLV
jgi:ATP-dependent Zn protease